MNSISPISYIRKQKKMLATISLWVAAIQIFGQSFFIGNSQPSEVIFTQNHYVEPDNFSDQTNVFNEPVKEDLTSIVDENSFPAIPSSNIDYVSNANIPVEKPLDYNENLTFEPETNKQGIIGKSETFPIDDPSDNVFPLKLNEIPKESQNIYLSYEIYGLADGSGAAITINDNFSRGGYLVKKSNAWIDHKEQINPEELIQGFNFIRFSTLESADYQYMVRNVQLIVEDQIDKQSNQKEFAIHQTQLNSYDGKLYISGFADKESDFIKINEIEVPVRNGNFESIVDHVDHEIKISQGEQMVTLSVNQKSESADQFLELSSHDLFVQSKFMSTTANVLTHQGASLNVPANSLNAETTFYMSALRYQDLSVVSPEMVNVTGNNFGYRLLPHGEHFVNAPATLEIPYDETKIPAGYKPQDIKTFYFDSHQSKWIALERDTVLFDRKVIVSKTTHFTDFINGIIKVPESPETGSFTPTSIKDIKAADPAAGVISISPPTPNNMGTAATSFPIKLPAGRAGMQPSLSVNYNSEGGNGWMGIGWDVSVPSISIDTRWGAPRYDSETETEIYSLGGGMLVLNDNTNASTDNNPDIEDLTNPHRTADIKRRGDRQFYPRIEGSYSKIVRHGNSPSNYWWEVTDKMGNKSFYGGYGSAVVPNAVIRTGSGSTSPIAHWALYRTEDTNGNYVEYSYTQGSSAAGHEFYPKDIVYTKHKKADTPQNYKVSFILSSPIATQSNDRTDVQTTARLGLVQATSKLLNEIKVYLMEGTTIKDSIRSYSFGYEEIAFFKKQLTKISEYDASGNLFYSNTMEYWDEVKSGGSYNLYGPAQQWSIPIDNNEVSALGGSENSGNFFGLAITAGVADFNFIQKNLTGGGNYVNNRGNSDGIAALYDINGDGMPDKVLNNMSYRPNLSNALGNISFDSNLLAPEGYNGNFLLQRNRSRSLGLEATLGYGGFSVNAGYVNTKSNNKTTTYITDVNGDGIMDVVRNKVVRFGYFTENGLEYGISSANTPNRIIGGVSVDGEVMTDPEEEEEEELDLRKENPILEMVKVWKAPYTGRVKLDIRAILQAFADPNNEFNEDGIRLRVERNGVLSPIVNTTITPGNAHSSSPATIYSVIKGDYFFFRVSAIDNGQNDVVSWENSSGETFVDYSSISPSTTALPHSYNDADGLSYHKFSIPKKEIFYTDGVTAFAPGYTGSGNVQVTATITGIVNKSSKTSDNIKLTFYRGNNGTYTAVGSVINLNFDYVGSQNINRVVTALNIGSTDGNGNVIIPSHSLKVVVSSDSNVDWEKVNIEDLKVNFSYAGLDRTFDLIPEYKFYNWQKQGTNVTNYPSAPHKVLVASNSLLFKPQLSFSNNTIDGSYKLIIKKLTSTGNISDVKNATVTVVNGVITNTVSIPLTVAVNDLLYFEYTTTSLALIQSTTIAQVTTSNGVVFNVADILAPANIFLTDSNDLYKTVDDEVLTNNDTDGRFGTMYRNWGSFAYNGGWGVYSHSDNPNYSNSPIALNELWLPTEDNIEEYQNTPLHEHRWFMLSPFISSNISLRWLGPDTDVWANGTMVSTGRMGIDDIAAELEPPYTNSAPGQFGAVGIDKQSKTRDNSESFGGSLFGVGLTATRSPALVIPGAADSKILSEFMDMNGDRYPDIIGNENIQYTNMLGGLSNQNISTTQNFFIIQEMKGAGAGGYAPSSYFTSSNSGQTGAANRASANTQNTGNNSTASTDASKLSASFSAGLSLSDNTDTQVKSISDINGDGLPDKLFIEDNKLWAELNLGYGFAEKREINTFSSIRVGHGKTVPLSASGAINLGNASISGGISRTEGETTQLEDFEDINGDGLLDKIAGNRIFLNTGNDFVLLNNLATNYFNNGFSSSSSKGSGTNIGFSICPNIPIIQVKFCINPSGGQSQGINYETLKLIDINGDGFTDIVSSNQDGNMTVRLNKTGKTHLLKQVNTPLGGSWKIDYEREQNTYEMPNAKWKMKEIIVNDGFTADNTFTPGETKATVEYNNPKHDRREREFMGYETVRVNQLDENGSLYRYSLQEFHNNSYYLKGAVKKESLYDANDVLWTSTETTYAIMNRGTTTPSSTDISLSDHIFNSNDFGTAIDKSSLFISPIKTTKTIYEQGNSKTTFTDIQSFDGDGNIKKYMDNGEGGSDVVTTEINYLSNATFRGLPTSIDVKIGGTPIRHREANYNTSNGNLNYVITKLNNSDNAKVSFNYDNYGNITKVTHEESVDENGQKFFYEYEYDDKVKTYPVTVTDAFGYSSNSTYDYRFGALVYSEDMNYQPMRTRIDDRGRVVEITGPYELFVEGLTNNDAAWTIRFEYKGEDLVAKMILEQEIGFTDYDFDAKGSFVPPSSTGNSSHHALTRHFDPEFRTNPDAPATTNEIYTITIIDGLGKPIQVKKSISVKKSGVTYHPGDITPAVVDARDDRKWLISGKVYTDAFGRAEETHYPIAVTYAAPTGTMFNYVATVSNTTPAPLPTKATYDVLDRILTTILPGETIPMTTSYSIDSNLFKTTVVNEKGQTKYSMTDIRGRTTKVVEQSNAEGDITTLFKYNAIGELLEVEDAGGNITQSFYDLAGRRTELRHPDNGITKFRYDKASNLISKKTSNLLEVNEDDSIKYNYTFNRLDSISYPLNPHNNVQFFYGQAEDASAADDFTVGRLWYQIDASGVQQFKYGRLGEVTYNLRSVAVPGDKAYWFQTKWEYDTWNRVKKIIYPDEEEISYFYNRGGELHAMTSKKNGQQNKNIVSQMGYDHFGQRTYLRYGNGTETTYTYEANRRRLDVMLVKSNTAGITGQNSSVNRTFINNKYTYDILSNITGVVNSATDPTTTQIGGKVTYGYTYDDLNRLTTANGIFTGRNSTGAAFEQQQYTLSMDYDKLHNIVSKQQLHQSAPGASGGVWTDVPATTYQLDYKDESEDGYGSAEHNVAGYQYTQPHAPRKIIDKPKLTSTGNEIKTKLYDYDANGNLTHITQQTGESETVEKLRTNLWDEENRLRAVDITPDAEGVRPIGIYTYDAGGERILKHSNTSVSIFLNGKMVADTIQTDATLYPSGMLVAKLGNNGSEEEQTLAYTKHYYAGTQRVSSKIGTTENLGDFLQDWYTGGTGGPVDVVGSSNGVLANAEEGVLKVYADLDIEPAPDFNSSPVFIPVASFIHGIQEIENYWFHPDHLGSSSYITNFVGEVSQHMEYFAFGETFVEEHRSSNNSPYKFNGKELDEETGWYYYGARYYDARTSVWLSVDPLANMDYIMNDEAYINGEHNGGIYNSFNHNSYGYCYQNPIKLIDPDGKQSSPSGILSGLDTMVEMQVQEMGEFSYRVITSFKLEIGLSAGVGLGFKATKYAQAKADLEVASISIVLNTGDLNIDVVQATGAVKVGKKGGLDLGGNLNVAKVNIENIQNIFKLESPDFDSFSFLSAEAKAQFVQLFEASGSAWAIQNKKGEWSFLDGKYGLDLNNDVFEKTDFNVEIKFGLKVKIGVDLKQLFNIDQKENNE